MKRLAALCIVRPVFAAMLILLLVVVGGASYFRLGIDRFPRIDLPQIAVRTILPGAAVEETETQITEPMEEAMNTVEGLTELRSITQGRGRFSWKVDHYAEVPHNIADKVVADAAANGHGAERAGH